MFSSASPSFTACVSGLKAPRTRDPIPPTSNQRPSATRFPRPLSPLKFQSIAVWRSARSRGADFEFLRTKKRWPRPSTSWFASSIRSDGSRVTLSRESVRKRVCSTEPWGTKSGLWRCARSTRSSETSAQPSRGSITWRMAPPPGFMKSRARRPFRSARAVARPRSANCWALDW